MSFGYNTPLDIFGALENTVCDAFSTVRQNFNMTRFGAMDVCTNNDNYQIIMIIPGVPGNDIDVNMDNGIMRVIANQNLEHNTQDNVFYRYLHNRGVIRKEFKLQQDADTSNVKCDYRDGVLIITIPRITSKNNKSKVNINVSDSSSPNVVN